MSVLSSHKKTKEERFKQLAAEAFKDDNNKTPEKISQINKPSAIRKKEQDSNTKGTPKEQDKQAKSNTKVTPREHQKGVTVTPLFDKKKQDSNTKVTPSKGNRTETPSQKLPRQQFKVYNWFTSRGYKGTFNKALIMRETGIAYHTIRKALWKFEDLELISLKYDRSVKEFEYNINPNIDVTGPGREQKGTLSEHQSNNIGTPSLIEEEDNIVYLLLGKIEILYPSIFKAGFEDKQLKEVATAWQLQGIDLKYLPLSLERADYAVEHKTFKADDPLAYVFKSLMRGQFYRPPKFKTRAELVRHEANPEEMKAATARLKQKYAGKTD